MIAFRKNAEAHKMCGIVQYLAFNIIYICLNKIIIFSSFFLTCVSLRVRCQAVHTLRVFSLRYFVQGMNKNSSACLVPQGLAGIYD